MKKLLDTLYETPLDTYLRKLVKDVSHINRRQTTESEKTIRRRICDRVCQRPFVRWRRSKLGEIRRNRNSCPEAEWMRVLVDEAGAAYLIPAVFDAVGDIMVFSKPWRGLWKTKRTQP